MPLDDPTTRIEIEVPHKEELAVIDEMIRLLRTPSNWCKGKEEIHGRHCLIGARNKVVRQEYDQYAADRVWERLFGIIGDHPVHFNDDRKTRHRDILSVLARTRASFE